MQSTMDVLQNVRIHRGFLKKPHGVYLHGTTGTGKTTAMHHFFDEANAKKISIHFNDYFLDISRLLQKLSLKQIAKEISKRIDLLCFDEFYVESIADGRILLDILKELHGYGTTIVLTSNFMPEELYHNGFNRKVLFPEFSDFLTSAMTLHKMSGTDFRKEMKQDFQIKFQNSEDVFLCFGYTEKIPSTLQIDDNHHITPQKQSETCAVFTYSSLFKENRSIKDYSYIAREFHHIHVSNAEKFSYKDEDFAIRFRNFIDALYSRNIIFTFDGDISFAPDMLQNIKFGRTQSRIMEMSSQSYIYHPLQQKRRIWNIEAKNFFASIGT